MTTLFVLPRDIHDKDCQKVQNMKLFLTIILLDVQVVCAIKLQMGTRQKMLMVAIVILIVAQDSTDHQFAFPTQSLYVNLTLARYNDQEKIKLSSSSLS